MEPNHDHAATLTEFWEGHYGASERVWSGRPNRVLVDVVSGLPAGRALDLGCGEGGDAIWLAQQGWQVTGLDVSTTAIGRARAAATTAGVAESITFAATDLAVWTGAGEHHDLVSACFFHSPVEVDRSAILRRAADTLAPGGHLLIVSHGAFPPWSKHDHDHDDYQFLSPQQEVAELALTHADWETLIAEDRSREATGPNGETALLTDVVVLLRRR
ncbi:class I SAM-dependent methyltransferase [Microlunatus speluncae]|uniref:class I SAM-dependent methyltransferase n=1 Tax=Microlunatus speluncae TaxID=2594267 RepID=UPI00126655B9|nr:class I SAM-dependent methyltransferase [Microlunatus speluncae]